MSRHLPTFTSGERSPNGATMNRTLLEPMPSTAQVVAQVALGVGLGLAASWLVGKASDRRQRRRASRLQDDRTPYQSRPATYNGNDGALPYDSTRTTKPRGVVRYLPVAVGTTAGAGYGTWYAMQPGADIKRALLYGVGLGLATHRTLRMVGKPASKLIRRKRTY
jgi:hypothetical protein